MFPFRGLPYASSEAAVVKIPAGWQRTQAEVLWYHSRREDTDSDVDHSRKRI